MLPSGTLGTLRFRRSPAGNPPPAAAAADSSERRKVGRASRLVSRDTLVREQINRSCLPWVPKLSVAFRLLILVRFCAAMYASIGDCDETFNYWEPSHYLVHGKGFQTWEYSPRYSIRSWFFILIHSLPAWVASLVFPLDKRPQFFATRILAAIVSSYAEAKLYRAVADHVNLRAARYFLGFTLFSAGMWSAAIAYLPSSFAMHAIGLAYSYVLEPVNSKPQARRRTFFASLLFVIATFVGWPFVAVLALPFVLEELSMYGDDQVMPASRSRWAASRFHRFFTMGLVSLALVLIPMALVDRLAYGKWVFVPLKIILYNVFPHKGGGPNLYGTEPPQFYLLNLLLNFNVVLPLALLSIPLLIFTARFSKTGAMRLGCQSRLANQTPATHLLLVRLVPVYVWLGLLSRQPHKEERFMYPIYTLISFNAAVTLSLVRGWMEDVYIRVTLSPYRAGRSGLFSGITRFVVILAASISLSRILALQYYYHAPMDLMFHFQYHELPVRAVNSYPSEYSHLKLNASLPILEAIERAEHTFDLGPLKRDNLSLCFGNSWYKFPTQFLVPDPINVDFVKSDFKGILPSKFIDPALGPRSLGESRLVRKRLGARHEGGRFNSMNEEESDRYFDMDQCEYFVGTSFPDRENGRGESELAQEVERKRWLPKKCFKLLDSEETKSTMVRTLWLPHPWWNGVDRGGLQRFGQMCLYARTRE